MGIEPTSEAWEASILPLYDARPRTNPGHYNTEPPAAFCSHFSALQVVFNPDEQAATPKSGPSLRVPQRTLRRSVISLFFFSHADVQ
jgi:hypothetical protein